MTTEKITKYSMVNGQYFESNYPKTSIFLHHTAGTSAKGAINWWNNTPDRVGVAFVIDRDGSIYQTMEATKWAYHLGIKGDDDYLEKASIGIELVAAGRVHEEEGKFFFYPLFPNKVKRVEIPKADVLTIKSGRFKGTFQKYSDEQVAACVELVRELVRTFKIKLQKDFGPGTLEFNADLISSKPSGLYSHSSVRADKIDILPQPNLIEALKGLF